jgi:hypothetical protein
MIAKKKYAVIFIAFMFLTSLAMVSVPVQSLSSPTFYIADDIAGKPVGTTFWVKIWVNASDLTFNGSDGIVGWALYVKVDPTILKPLNVRTSMANYFLMNFSHAMDYPNPSYISTIDPSTGLVDVSEQILPTPPGGAATDGVLPAPYRLVQIQYESLSLYGNSTIDIFDAEYMDTYGYWHPVVDGDATYVGIPIIPHGANLVGKKVWPEHHHFKLSRDGDPNVTDSHGTEGVQTLYAKVKNTGEINITVRAVWRLMKGGAVEPVVMSDETVIEPGKIVIVQDDAREFLPGDIGKWYVEGKVEYYSIYSEVWVEGATKRTTAFNIVA